jgi:benzoate/toluate 1,2-dioxygenase reductase subunit
LWPFAAVGWTDALLLHGVGTPDRLIYRDILQSGLREYVPCISRPGEYLDGLDHPFPGRVTRYLEKQLKPGTYDFYLCGRGGMIRDATALIDERFGDSRLYIENYD